MANKRKQVTVDLNELQALLQPSQIKTLTGEIKATDAQNASKTLQANLQFVNRPLDRDRGYQVVIQEKNKQYLRKDERVVEKYYVLSLTSSGRMNNKNFSSVMQLKALGVTDAKVLAYAEKVETLNRCLKTIDRFVASQS